MWTNPQKPTDLLIFTREILIGKLHFFWEVFDVLYSQFVSRKFYVVKLQESPFRFNPLAPTPLNGQTYWNNSSGTADELFECVWPFYGIGIKRVECICEINHVGTSSSDEVVLWFLKNYLVKSFNETLSTFYLCVYVFAKYHCSKLLFLLVCLASSLSRFLACLLTHFIMYIFKKQLIMHVG